MLNVEFGAFVGSQTARAQEDDRLIERELAAAAADGAACEPLVRYRVAIHTGTRRGAGTSARPFLRVYGDKATRFGFVDRVCLT